MGNALTSLGPVMIRSNAPGRSEQNVPPTTGNDSATMAAPSGWIVMLGPASSAVARGPVDVLSPARPVSSASEPIARAAVAKAEVDRLFREYQSTPYTDAIRRNNLRRQMLAAGGKLMAQLLSVRPTTEQERLRLRAIAASALASSQLRQRCFMSGAAGCGRFGVNEPDGPSKANDEFMTMTRPLDTFIKTSNTTPVSDVLSPARPVSSASEPIARAAVAKAEVDRLFREYQSTPYTDAIRRNNLRRQMLAAGGKLMAQLLSVRPTTEQERLRLRAIAASALASSQLRQRCFMSGAAGCGRFGVNEPDGPSKANDEFMTMTRPLDTFIKTSNTTPLAVPEPPRVTVVVAGRPIATVAPSATEAAMTAAKESATVAAAKLASDVATAQKVTNPETKVAADKVVIAQAGADAAAKAAEEKAEQAKRAAETALQATQAAQASGAAADAQAAQAAAQVADAAHAAAEQATVAAAEAATVADAVRSELEVAATVTNDVPAQEAIAGATMTVAVATAGLGPLGISWKAWGIGAAVLVGGYVLLNTKALSSNRRKRVRRNRRRIAR